MDELREFEEQCFSRDLSEEQEDSEGKPQAAWVETAHLKLRHVGMFQKRKTVMSLDSMSKEGW